MNETGQQMTKFAQRLWNDFFSRRVRETQKTMLRYYQARVTTAASGGTMGVKRPFDETESFLPYVSTMADASVGAQVVVLVFGEGKTPETTWFLCTQMVGICDKRVTSIS